MLPEYANGGSGPPPGRQSDDPNRPHIKEVWFAGSHSDMFVPSSTFNLSPLTRHRGGGNVPNLSLDRFGPALRWMMDEAQLCDLRVEPFERAWKGAEHNPSMKGLWKVLEYLPIRRLSYHTERHAFPNQDPQIPASNQILDTKQEDTSQLPARRRSPRVLRYSKDETERWWANLIFISYIFLMHLKASTLRQGASNPAWADDPWVRIRSYEERPWILPCRIVAGWLGVEEAER